MHCRPTQKSTPRRPPKRKPDENTPPARRLNQPQRTPTNDERYDNTSHCADTVTWGKDAYIACAVGACA